MLGNRDTGERRSDNLSIARQEDETGRLKVQTIEDIRGHTGAIMDIQIPLLVIDRRGCLDHVWSDPEPWGNTLKGG
jgi:hypothetical protein